ncbi:hypothetical protein K1719_018886 [Acacia pycnantha]|nr:hypothetical protein K1719_018886 [Acacia pycnantha]
MEVTCNGNACTKPSKNELRDFQNSANSCMKLLAVPPIVTKLCAETMACGAEGNWRKFMKESSAQFPSDSIPCSILPDDVSILKRF